MVDTKTIEKIIDIGRMSLAFGRVNRQTLHEDGVTPESDTDHTVMLSLCACALAQKLYPRLQVGKVAEFCAVHDLVEVYTGDVPTFGIDTDAKIEKEHRERRALEKLETNYGDTFPWLHGTISEYERLDTAEARFVKLVDKIMPKITQHLNHSAQFIVEGLTKDQAKLVHDKQLQYYREHSGDEFPEIVDILELMMIKSRELL